MNRQHRGDINERAAIVFGKARQHGIGQTHQGSGVQHIDRLMLRHIAREERCHLRGAGIVDQRVDGVIAAKRFLHRADPGFLGQICRQGRDLHPVALL
ncbi:hypothetical protein D3C75_1159340 [compost metagenome]